MLRPPFRLVDDDLPDFQGPVPGIALGVVCALLFHATGQHVFRDGARAFLLVNTFNLLPFIPLDGGHRVEAILFSRSPSLRALFTVGAGFGLAFIACVAHPVFGVIAFFVFASVRDSYFTGKLAAQLKRELGQGAPDSGAGDHVPSQYLERLIPLLEQHLPEQMCTAPGIAAAVRRVWNMVWFKPPSLLVSACLLLLYLGCLVVGVIATVGAEASFQSAAGSANLP